VLGLAGGGGGPKIHDHEPPRLRRERAGESIQETKQSVLLTDGRRKIHDSITNVIESPNGRCLHSGQDFPLIILPAKQPCLHQ